jgi:hypothetical protein
MIAVDLARPDLGGIWYTISSTRPPKTKKLRIARTRMMSTHDSGVSFLIVVYRVLMLPSC